jgi:glucosamine--fructose-6-phosphate aminotransferase (isomerizing)
VGAVTALSETIAAQATLLEPLLRLDLGDAPEQLARAERIWLVGTGTSQHAAELGALMFSGARSPALWRSGAGFALVPALGADDAVIIISHTAETTFARRARDTARKARAAVVSITGRGRGWTEAIETIEPECSETYTASYLAAVVVIARLAVASGLAPFDEGALAELPALVDEACRGAPLLPRAPERLLVLTGAGPGATTAREGALKLREAARLPAEGYEAEYLLHGSAVPLGSRDALIVLEPANDPEDLVALVAAAAAEEGVAVCTVAEETRLHPVLSQIPMTARLQVLAAHLADAGGHDPDAVITGAWANSRLWPGTAAKDA